MHTTVAEEEGQDLDEGEIIFVQNGGTRGGVNWSYVLLHNQSTVNQIANPSLLANIRTTKNLITIHFNNGSSYMNLEGDLGGVNHKQSILTYYYVVYTTKFEDIPENIFKLVFFYKMRKKKKPQRLLSGAFLYRIA